MLSLAALSVVLAALGAAANELLFGSAVPEFSIAGVAAGSGPDELAGSVHVAAAAVHVAAVADDPYADACSTAVDVVTYCYDVLPTNAPTLDQAYCFCCLDEGADTEFLAPAYSSCEDYISASATTDTAAASVISVVESFCYSVSRDGFTCGTSSGPASAAATATRTPTATSAFTSAFTRAFTSAASTKASTSAVTSTASAASANTAEPSGCTLFASMYSSCARATPGFSTLNDPDAASCLCYSRGQYETVFDDYVSQCGVWITTASPTAYSNFAALTTFCEEFPPGTTASVVATFSDKIATFGGSGGSSSAGGASSAHASASSTPASASASAAVTSPTTKTPKTVTVSPTASTAPTAAANAAGRGVQGGFAAWLAVVLPFVL